MPKRTNRNLEWENAYSLKKVHTVQETEVTDPLNSC